MNLKLLSVMSIVFVSGYFLGIQTSEISEDSIQRQANLSEASSLKAKLDLSNNLNDQLKEKILAVDAKSSINGSSNDSLAPTIDEQASTNQNFGDDDGAAGSSDKKTTLMTAYDAFEKGDMEDATKQFNELLALATTASERSEVIDGLIAIHEATYQAIMEDGEHIHGAMWQLFEMQKLRPQTQTVERAKLLSNEILSRANEYLDANNLLGASDYFNTLVHTTNMMEYEIDGITRDALTEKVAVIEAQAGFKDSLYQRASNNLMNGTAIEKNMAFWDFTKLAGLDSGSMVKDVGFSAQFADATLVHLQHLKEMNQPGEVKSRLDYIRYVFPSLMKDERIHNFF